MGFLSSLGNAVSSIGQSFGGLLGGVGGALISSNAQEKQNDKQIELQREFAQNGIQWKVEDAKKAGIHPLYALGAQTVSYSPMSVGTPDYSSIGAQFGQNLGSALQGREQQAKQQLYNDKLQDLDLETRSLQNDLLRAQISQINTSLAQGQDIISGVPTQGISNDVKKSILKSFSKKTPISEGVEEDQPSFSLSRRGQDEYGDSIYDILPNKDKSDWLQDLSLANLPDAVSYLYDKISPSSNTQGYWEQRAKDLTREGRKSGSLKPDELMIPYWTPFGWRMKKTNLKKYIDRLPYSFKHKPTNFYFPNF